jgi:hypothetical protein
MENAPNGDHTPGGSKASIMFKGNPSVSDRIRPARRVSNPGEHHHSQLHRVG